MTTEQLNQYLWVLIIVAVWDLVWKGFALWRAAKNDSQGWFIALLVINTVGLLPILYLYVFGKNTKAGS